MNRANNPMLRLLEPLARFFTGGIREYHTLEDQLRIRVSNIICFLTILILAYFGTTALARGEWILGFSDLSVALVSLMMQLYLRRTGNYAVIRYVWVISTGALFVYLFNTGGVEKTGHLWGYIFPIVAAFLLGARKGALAIAMGLAAITILWTIDHFQGRAVYPSGLLIRFLISSSVVSFAACYYEYYRQELLREQAASNLQLRKTNAALESANRAKSDFLANMSHELRTPLNHIMGFTELVVDRQLGELNEKQAEYLNDVLRSSRHLLSLINDILDLSKVEAGKMELQMAEVDLASLLEGSLGMVREQVKKKGIQLFLRREEAPEKLRADERKLRQIIYNLLSNAVKFTPDDGTVTVTVRRLTRRGGGWFTPAGKPVLLPLSGDDPLLSAGGVVDFFIRDTGIGIRDEDLQRIFEPFEQVENSLTRRYAGSGLGLSLTRKLVDLHGGRIWAESEGEGLGSTFHVLLTA